MKTNFTNIELINSGLGQAVLYRYKTQPKTTKSIYGKIFKHFVESKVTELKKYYDYSTEDINILKRAIKKEPQSVFELVSTPENDSQVHAFFDNHLSGGKQVISQQKPIYNIGDVVRVDDVTFNNGIGTIISDGGDDYQIDFGGNVYGIMKYRVSGKAQQKPISQKLKTLNLRDRFNKTSGTWGNMRITGEAKYLKNSDIYKIKFIDENKQIFVIIEIDGDTYDFNNFMPGKAYTNDVVYDFVEAFIESYNYDNLINKALVSYSNNILNQ